MCHDAYLELPTYKNTNFSLKNSHKTSLFASEVSEEDKSNFTQLQQSPSPLRFRSPIEAILDVKYSYEEETALENKKEISGIINSDFII